MKRCIPLLFLALGLFMSGCVTQLNSNVAPGVSLHGIKTIYVVHHINDGRRIDKVIVDRLALLGYKASSGPESMAPADADALLTYQDRWMWDITMYMISLDIQLRRPGTGIALASGHTLRTSLARRAPPEMIDEVLKDLLRSAN